MTYTVCQRNRFLIPSLTVELSLVMGFPYGVFSFWDIIPSSFVSVSFCVYESRVSITTSHSDQYLFILNTRAVRLIEIEIKSWFELARFLNRFIARFFSSWPNLPQYAIRTNQNAAEQNRPGIQTDSMLKKQGRWVQNSIRTWTWWPKKCVLHVVLLDLITHI